MTHPATGLGVNVLDAMSCGKPIVGTIALNAFQKGNHVVIEVEDDGAGMDPRRIVDIAVRRGMIGEDEAKSLSSLDRARDDLDVLDRSTGGIRYGLRRQ